MRDASERNVAQIRCIDIFPFPFNWLYTGSYRCRESGKPRIPTLPPLYGWDAGPVVAIVRRLSVNIHALLLCPPRRLLTGLRPAGTGPRAGGIVASLTLRDTPPTFADTMSQPD